VLLFSILLFTEGKVVKKLKDTFDLNDHSQNELQNTLNRLGKTIEKRKENSIIQFPLWPEVKRGTPNSFLRSALFSATQGKDRVYMEEMTLFSQKGITVKYTGMQLNQEDLTLWETLVHLAKQHPLGNECVFTAHNILRELGLSTGGKNHKILHSGIIRLTACAVEIVHEEKTYFGSLIGDGTKDELTGHYNIELNKKLIRLFGDTQWTAIDWQQRLELRRKPLAQFLHGYYSSHREPYPIKLETLYRLASSRNSKKGFKQKVKVALEILVAIGFLQSFQIEGDLVSVKRAQILPDNAILMDLVT